MWKCKYCIFDSAKRGVLLKHYRLKHGAHTKTSPGSLRERDAASPRFGKALCVTGSESAV